MPRKPKTPQEKKRDSPAKDRRNTYVENAKASRRNIPRRKAQGHRAARRIANQALASATRADPEIADALEVRLKVERLKGWVKVPDEPLGEVLAAKRRKRAALAGRKARRRSAAGQRSVAAVGHRTYPVTSEQL